MFSHKIYRYLAIACITSLYAGCKIPILAGRSERTALPAAFAGKTDTTNAATIKWQQYFTDAYLTALIDTALNNNQELNIRIQEMVIAQNEIRVRKGEYLPFAGVRGGAGVDKVGRYTSQGASEANIDIAPGRATPEPLPDYQLAAYATWEIDIWHKLRNAKKAAVNRYMGTVAGKNFVTTMLVAEIANAYYELLALDNQLDIVRQNMAIQANALEIVRLQKLAAHVTELAVRRFEAEVLKTNSMQYDILQRITETENRISFLTGSYPRPIPRDDKSFGTILPIAFRTGLPAQLLANRPDIKQAEMELAASKLDVMVAKARFYPSLGISTSIGYRAFNPAYLLKMPESILYSMAGEAMAPLVNRNAIKATYYSANARQVQAAYHYEQVVLKAYLEVVNQLAMISNLEKSYELKSKQVQALTESITISGDLFRSARADYMEVLLTQRDALESKFELIETKKKQMNAVVNIYQALGGGWN